MMTTMTLRRLRIRFPLPILPMMGRPTPSSSPPVVVGSAALSASSRLLPFTNHEWERKGMGMGRRWFGSHQVPVIGGGEEESGAVVVVEVPLAQTGEGIAECELLQWFVSEGDQVEEFQRLCEVQSDKATIEITSRFKGKVHQINFFPGDIVKVGETLLRIGIEDFQSESHGSTASTSNELSGGDVPSHSDEYCTAKGVLATPAVRHLAKQYGLNIGDILGTGKDGRISKGDVLNYAVSKGLCKETPPVMDGNFDEFELLENENVLNVTVVDDHNYEDKTIPLRGFQRSMVKSMSMAAKVPHFHYLEEINCNALVKLKAAFQDENDDDSVKHTFLPFLIKTLSMALGKYPLLNSSFSEETYEVILKGSHNIGVAMATSRGLVVPNIKKVQSLSILEITKELARLHQMASQNKLTTEEITGGTITLSNIGAIGGKFGSPLLNLPEVAIIALGRIQKLPCFDDDDETIYPASVTNVTIGADHRVVDGATVARFCNEWKRLIEKPQMLLLRMR